MRYVGTRTGLHVTNARAYNKKQCAQKFVCHGGCEGSDALLGLEEKLLNKSTKSCATGPRQVIALENKNNLALFPIL